MFVMWGKRTILINVIVRVLLLPNIFDDLLAAVFDSLYNLVVLYSNTQELTNVDYYFHVDSMLWDRLPFTKPTPVQHNMYNINMLYLL